MFLPPLKFFRPKWNFVTFMEQSFKGRTIYDVGAGMGHVTKELVQVGLNVIGFDINLRDGEYPVQPGNGLTYSYEPGSVAMFCRPCHGFFVEMSIQRALYCGVTTFVYVGLGRNIRHDLGSFRHHFKLKLRNAGSTKECVWIWNRERQ